MPYAILVVVLMAPVLLPVFFVTALLSWAGGNTTPFGYAWHRTTLIPMEMVWLRGEAARYFAAQEDKAP